MTLFENSCINTGRQCELDWARGLAVFFMILVHIKLELPGFPFENLYSKVIEFVGSPLAAPTFMILLGAGIVYSRHHEPKNMVKHGLKLLALHYVLNFVAFGLPYLTLFIQTGDAEYSEDFFNYLFCVDILAFAGLTFLFFALKEKLQWENVHLVLVTLVLVSLNYLITWAMNDLWAIQGIGLFVKSNDYSYFPFLSWIGYPVMGYIFGKHLIRCADKKRFYKYLFAFSILIVAAITLGSYKYDFDIWSMHFGPDDYYYQDFIQYILVGGICFAWISILYLLTRIKFLGFLGKLLARWSKNVTAIYFAQWFIIGWISIFFKDYFPAEPLINISVGIIVVIFSDVLAVLYLRVSEINKKRQFEIHPRGGM